MVNVNTLVWYYTIIYSGIGIVFGMAMFLFSFNVYYTFYVKKLYVAPPSVLF